MKPKVLFIFLDAADADLVEQYVDEGLMPTMGKFFKAGQYQRLKSLEHSLAESVQVSFFTGHEPDTHGFHGPHIFDPVNYSNSMNLVSGFDKVPPFFDLGNDIDVLSFDLPMCPVMEGRPYVQIIDWGCHGFAVGGSASREEIWDDLMDNIGLHPEHGIDFALLGSPESCHALYERQLEGIQMRSRAMRYLMEKYPWQLAMTATSETHTGAHYLMKHPGNATFYESLNGKDPVKEIYRETDRYLNELIEAAGNETEVLVASVEGMSVNHAEVSNIAFLPEMLFRYSFPGERAFDYDTELLPMPDEVPAEVRSNWVVQTSRHAARPSSLQQQLRKHFSESAAINIERLLKLKPAPYAPETRPVMNYQPTVWLEPYWPHMRAFALPTFSDGFIRLNVKGREARGVVSPDQFIPEVERVCRMLELYHSSETGVSPIERIERVRDHPEQLPDATPADLIVFWKDHEVGQLVSKEYGSIGALPALRAGVHNSNAFVMGCGPRLTAESMREAGHIFDIAPTIIDLLQMDPPAPLPGKSLLAC